jgi:tetratricopeptide (TPR) repeat protein
MMDDLQQAYSAYQQALYHLRDPKVVKPISWIDVADFVDQEPKLWYGIGILYDRYGSLEHAEEAFSQVMRMQPDFEKANEIYFRLGIQTTAEVSAKSWGKQSSLKQAAHVTPSLIVCSVSDTLFPCHRPLWLKRTFGSKLDMSMSSRKMWVD